MKINCPNCNKEFDINEELLWKKAKCSTCQNIFILWEKKQEAEIFFQEENTSLPKKENNISEQQNISFVADCEIKPKKMAYIFFWNGILVFFLILFWISLIFAFIFPWLFFISWVLAIICWISYWLSNISHQKEKYIFQWKKIIYTYGWLFSDNTVEIDISKITQVISNIPFLENIFFQTGNITIKTAGSTSGKIRLKSIENVLFHYEEIQKRMQQNGFHLKKENLVMEAKPHVIGAIWESLYWLWSSIFVLLFLWWNIILSLQEVVKENEKFHIFSWIIMFIILMIIFIWPIFLKIIFKYLDLKMRVYQIYDDSVFYIEWFLSKNYAFIPMENISDTENNQSFFSKIFWIHDVIVSSEWSNNEVYFYNIVNGKKMMETIKYLKEHVSLKPVIQKENITLEGNSWEKIEIQTQEKRNLNYDTEFMMVMKPNMLKTFLSNSVYILWIYTIPIFIINFVKAFFTTFHITRSNFEYKYEFFTTKHNIFSVDKITKVVMSESLLDTWLWTCSISFSSIWSSNSLTFSNITKTPELFEKVLSKVWIYQEEPKYIIPISYGVWELFKANIFIAPILILSTSILLFTPLIALIIYNKYYYHEKYYKHTIFQNYISSFSWVIFQTKEYTIIDNIKGIEWKKYPFTQTWTFIFDVSGDSSIQYWKNANQYSIISNGVKIPYVKDINEVFDEIDTILHNNTLDRNIIWEKKQDLWNTLLVVIPWSLFTVIFAPIVIWITIWYIKSKKYVLENSRIIQYWWIIYKCKKSILYEKIDFLEENQWMIHKIFWNGDVSIYTKWSGSSDLSIVDISEHKKIYSLLKEQKIT